MTRPIAALIAAVCTLGTAACGSDDDGPTNPGPPGTPTVTATTSSTFSPGTLDIETGESVRFVFQALAHNVVFTATTGAPADIGIVANTSVTRLFSTAGNFVYDCTVHPGMRGTIRVSASAESTSGLPGY